MQHKISPPLIDILKKDLSIYLNLDNKVQYNFHNSFDLLDNNNIYSIATLRNPIERTISHWLHFYQNKRRISPELEKKEIINYLLSTPDSCLINYQCKFISNNYIHFHHGRFWESASKFVCNFSRNIANACLVTVIYIYGIDFISATFSFFDRTL